MATFPENSEYDEAKNEQAMVEARIVQIETMLKNVKVLDDDELNTETVNVGSKIKIKDLEYDEVLEYHLVGSTEADPTKGKISDESPVGKALLGHRVGETVEAEAPAGVLRFEILEILK